MSRFSASLLIAVVTAPAAPSAQTAGSFGIGFGTVRFPGGSSFGVVSLGPALQVVAPGRELSLRVTVAALPEGDWYVQGRSAAWATTPPFAHKWRLGAEVGLSGATGGAGTGSGAGQLTAEVLRVAPGWGIGLGMGPSSGWISGAPPVTALRYRLRGWWLDPSRPLALSTSVEPTRFLGAWFTDVGAGLQARRGPLETRVWTSGRISAVYGSKAAAQASVELWLTKLVTLEASGGSVLPDPYQGFPRSGFLTASAWLRIPPRATPEAAARRTGRQLTITRRDGGVVIRFRRAGARSVSIAGDWNGWTPTPLTQTSRGTWQAVLPLSRGTHNFMLLIDDTAWIIPEGLPSVPDGMGGRVGVLTVL